MVLPPALDRTLSLLRTSIAGVEEPWWVIGSAAVVLHDRPDPHVADVDVLLGRRSAARLFPALGIVPSPGTESGLFRSELFGRWCEGPLPIEFMAGFHVRGDRGWTELRPATREPVAGVFVPSRDELCRILRSFGRPKDLERARLLAGG